MLSDGAGGAFIVWNGTIGNDIFVQRVSAAGLPLWTPNGVLVCGAGAGQGAPTLASDGAGGVIVAWHDFRSGTGDIYAQRVNDTGIPQWTANGIPICATSGDQLYPQLVTDGTGGAIMSWIDSRGAVGYDIYAQRVNGSGAVQWTANGVLLCNAANDQNASMLATDGTGGAVVVWQDQRAGVGVYDVWGQRVSSGGALQWAVNGISFCPATGNQFAPRIVSDGGTGVITTWYDTRSASADIYAQHTTASGTMLWNSNGTPICVATNEQNLPMLTTDGLGGAIIAWADYRNGGVSDVFAQRINGSGTPQWTANGVALSTFVNSQSNVAIAPDGAQGAIVSWQDFRGFSSDVYAQRVSAAGVPLWATDGVAVCTAVGTQQIATLVSDGAAGAIFAWQDYRAMTESDTYAQRVERYGQLGSPGPAIASVRDVPNDQGGKVRVSWNASYLDGDPYNLVANYWIWRQAPGAVATAAMQRGALLESDGGTPEVAPNGFWKTTIEAGQVYYWEYLASQPAQGFVGYSYVASTTGDSIAGSNPRTLFLVEAKSSGTAYWASAPDSGYSVDDLAPATPAPLTGQYTGGSTTLHWGVSGESDFLEYRLHRGNTSTFVPGPSNLVAARPDTGYTDAAGAPYYYKLAAVDVHGNISGYATLLPLGTVDVTSGAMPARVSLAGARPNPVRAGAELGFVLPAACEVALSLYDQQGRAVRMLADGVLPAGEHSVQWNGRDRDGTLVPSGVYFLRLRAGTIVLCRRLAVLH